MNICKLCSNSTKNTIFCSRKCSNIYRNNNCHPRKNTGKGKPFCKKCNINRTPSYSHKLCQKCSKNRYIYSSDPTLSDLYVLYKNAKHSTGMQAYIRGHAREVILKTTNSSCKKCNYSHHVEVCHIKPISAFTNESRLSEINNIRNLVLLCPNCHWELDHGIFTITN